ncbi:MAG: SDR family oxidoreductase [Chloroflexi bacterium]|nr:SDR family oxidoreductase [Chloroflexota bacterium]
MTTSAQTDNRKIALVTGAGSGVGRAASVALAGAGYTLVLVGRRRELLDETAALLVASDGNTAGSLVLAADVADESAVERVFDAVRDTYGRLDLLFNNAGIGLPATPFEEVAFEDWKRVVDTNVNGAFLCARAAYRMMKAQTPSGGRIINNGSISAHTPRLNAAAYTTTKHAMTGLTKSLALEGRHCGITCGQIDIGNAATPMTERMNVGTLQADGTLRPEPRMDVDDVGRAIVYMASLPPDANVLSMTVMAAEMPFVGRG